MFLSTEHPNFYILLFPNTSYRRLRNKMTGLAQAYIGVMISAIVGVAITIPIVINVINSANITDATTKTILTYVPLFIALSLLVAVAFLMGKPQ